MNYNDDGTIKQITVKAGDTLPVGTEVDVPDGTTIPAGWEEVEDNHAKIVYRKQLGSGQSDTYTFARGGLYLLIAHTNGDDHCIMDVIMPADGLYTTRIKSENSPFKTITYSGFTVTMNNTNYTGRYCIIKIY